MQEVCDFLKKCGTYYIATVDKGLPRVRPFGTAHIFNGKLYIQTGRKKEFSHQVANDPHIEICAFDGATWLRIEATLVNDDSIDAQRAVLEAYPELSGMYKAGDGNSQVLWLRDATAVFSSFTAPSRVVKF